MKKSLKGKLGLVAVLMASLHGLYAYVFTPDRWPNNVAAGGIVMHLQLGSPPSTLTDGSTTWGEVAERALNAWNVRLDSSRFRFTVVKDSTIPKASGDGKNSVFFAPNRFGLAFGPETVAVAEQLSVGGVRHEADVIFDSSETWNSYRGNKINGIVDFYRIALHEFGHVVGLDHPDEAGQTVSAVMHSLTTNIGDLQPDDIQGGQALWGVPGPSLSRSSRSVSGAGGNFSFDIEAYSYWSWTQSSGSASWLTISEPLTQSGNQTFAYNVGINTGATSRSATITITAGGHTRTHTVNQAAAQPGILRVYDWSNFAGSPGMPGSVDGTGSAARFGVLNRLAIDGSGNIFVSDSEKIRKISPNGDVTTLAGEGTGAVDGTGSAARFSSPGGLAVDASGNVYVADTFNHAIRKVTPAGVVTTYAGRLTQLGFADGQGNAARFKFPRDLAIDSLGNLYVADSDNYTLRKITPDRVVTTLAGQAGVSGHVDGVGSAARFLGMQGIAVDGSGHVYVTNSLGGITGTVRKVTPAGEVTTLAGTAAGRGSDDGPGLDARFDLPMALAVDTNGNLFVVDSWNNTIRQISPTGVVTTLGGLPGVIGSADGRGSNARFYWPWGVAVGQGGILFVADSNNLRISVGVPSDIQIGAFEVSAATQSAGAASGSFSFNVTASANWSWSIQGGSGWVSSSEAGSQNGNQTFSYALAANPTTSSRTATLTLTSGTFVRTHVITQEGIQPDDHGDSIGTATLMGVSVAAQGQIGVAGDQDYFRINLAEAGILVVDSIGTTDTFGLLLDAGGNELASDNNSGDGSNFQISRALVAGAYYVRVSHVNSVGGTGGYQVVYSFTASPVAPEIAVEQPAGTELADGSGVVDFGQSRTGLTVSRAFTIRNTGNAELTGLTPSLVGPHAGDFTPGSPGAVSLAPGASTTFEVVFMPSAAGARAAILRVASNDANENPYDITLNGLGTLAAPEIVIEQPEGTSLNDGAAVVNYGTVLSGSTSTRSFTLHNAGDASLSGLSLGIMGPQAADFVPGALASSSLAPGESMSFTVAFIPVSGGIRAATFLIASNDADENPFEITLTGTSPIPGGNVTDNFDDNVLNTARWLKEDFTEQGTVAETGKRLNYTATVVTFLDPPLPPFPDGNGESHLALLSSQPSYAEDWEVMVDVTNSATTGNFYDWQAGAVLEIYDANLARGNRISLQLGAFNSGQDGPTPSQFGRTFVGGLMTGGVDNPDLDDELPAIGTNTAGVLRVAFQAASKVFTLSVDRSGPANGLQWETLATYGIAGAGGSRNADWAMTDVDAFQIHLMGRSYSVAVNSGQVTFDNFRLTRSGVSPVEITQQPASRTIVSGQTTPLTVGVSGFPVACQWYAGSSGDTSQPIAGATAATYTTPALTTAASYWVRVGNSLGTLDSQTVVISISTTPLPPTFATQPASQLAFLGQALSFNLTVTGTNPLTYQWSRGSSNITNEKSSSLTFASLKTSDAGLYSLRATNSVTTKDSDTAYVGIVTRGPNALGVNIGTTLTLNAVVTPPPGIAVQYRWQQNGENLPAGGRRSGTGEKTLKITGAVPTDAGSYTCIITLATPAGNVTGTNGETAVSVVEKPVFDAVALAARFDDVRVGQEIDFTITAANSPTKFAITGLPPGLKLDTASGRIHGVPTTAKIVKGVVSPHVLKISASNTAGSSMTETVSWTVHPLYPGVIGTYNGLVAHDPVNQDLGGSLKLTVASTAALSGTLKLGALSYPLSGSLSFAGMNDTAAGRISILRKAPLTTLVTAFEINKETGKLTGTVADDASGPAELAAWLAPWGSAKKADDYVATYNTALDPGSGEGPEGYGFLPVKVTSTGAVSWTGKLADGTGITGSTSLGPDGQIAFQQNLYSNTGSIQGWMKITSETGYLDGQMHWFKAEQPEKSTTRSYKGGFANTSVMAIGAPYIKPAGAVLDLPTPDLLNAKVALICGKAEAAFPVMAEHLFTITNKNAVTADTPNDHSIKLSLAATTGTFSGSITLNDDDPTDLAEPFTIIKRTVSYTGILVTREGFNKGAGYFIVDELPFMEPIPDTERERRITLTPQWSGGVTLEAVAE